MKRTSIPKMAPAIGVPKTEAKPALMPQITSSLRSWSSTLRMSEKIEEIPAPIWAQGPSFTGGVRFAFRGAICV